MKNILILLFAFGFYSCGTSKKESKPVDELESITNDSFKWPSPKPYQDVDDFLDDKVAYKEDVLKSETLAKVPKEEIVEVGDVDKNLDKAIVACYRRDFSLADKIFDALLKTYRKNPIYWNQVGNCFMIKGEERKALLYFNKSKDLKKNYAPPVNNIGVIFQGQNEDQKAIKAYQEAKSISSFSLTPVFNLAQLYAKYGFIDEGKVLYETLIRLNNNDQDLKYGLGFFLLASGDIKGAVNTFSSLSRDYRKKPEVAVNVAYALALSGEKGDAKNVLEDMKDTNDGDLQKYAAEIRRIAR